MEWMYLSEIILKKIKSNVDTADLMAHMKILIGINKSKQIKKIQGNNQF